MRQSSLVELLWAVLLLLMATPVIVAHSAYGNGANLVRDVVVTLRSTIG